MNDESLTPEAELASAALDNEVTTAERAKIAASPALSDKLSFYSDLRARLADVPVPDTSRESALAAAMSAYAELHPAESPAESTAATERRFVAAERPVASVVSLHQRRQRQYRWLGGAAAAAAVVVLGVGVVTQNLEGSDDKKTSSATLGTQPKTATVPTAAADAGAASANSTAAADEALPAPAAETSGEFEINSPAVLDAWVSAPTLDTHDDVIDFVKDDMFGRDAQRSVDAPVQSAAETNSATETTAAAASTAPAAAAQDADVAAYSNCPMLFFGPSSAAIYKGERVFVVLDKAAGEILIVEPIACTVVDTVPYP